VYFVKYSLHLTDNVHTGYKDGFNVEHSGPVPKLSPVLGYENESNTARILYRLDFCRIVINGDDVAPQVCRLSPTYFLSCMGWQTANLRDVPTHVPVFIACFLNRLKTGKSRWKCFHGPTYLSRFFRTVFADIRKLCY
jgi:hypothetical protein